MIRSHVAFMLAGGIFLLIRISVVGLRKPVAIGYHRWQVDLCYTMFVPCGEARGTFMACYIVGIIAALYRIAVIRNGSMNTHELYQQYSQTKPNLGYEKLRALHLLYESRLLWIPVSGGPGEIMHDRAQPSQILVNKHYFMWYHMNNRTSSEHRGQGVQTSHYGT